MFAQQLALAMSPVSSEISQAVRSHQSRSSSAGPCEDGLYVGERSQCHGFHQRRPRELALSAPASRSNRTHRTARAATHAQAGLRVFADAGEIDAVSREQRQQIQ